MVSRIQASSGNIRLVRYAVWGQLIGYLSFGLSLVAEDSPDFFSRVSAIALIWPFIVLAAMHLFRLDAIAATYVPRWLLATSVLAISVGTLAASVTGVAYAFGIPRALATEGWRYMQATTSLTMAIFAASLLISVVLAVRTYRDSGSASPS